MIKVNTQVLIGYGESPPHHFFANQSACFLHTPWNWFILGCALTWHSGDNHACLQPLLIVSTEQI